jgi:hypothetical protein
MFLDSFPMHEPEVRAHRPLRETAVEAGKSRSAWPFIVAALISVHRALPVNL